MSNWSRKGGKSERIRTVLRLLRAKGGPQRGDLKHLAEHFDVSYGLVSNIWSEIQYESVTA